MPSYLYLPGTAGNYTSTPDISAYDGSTSYRFTIGLRLEDYTPAAESEILFQIGNNFQDCLRLKTDGALEYLNNSSVKATSASPVSATDGLIAWFRAIVTIGAGTGAVEFLESMQQTTDIGIVSFSSISNHTSLTISALAHSPIGIHIGADAQADDFLLGPVEVYYSELLVDGSIEFLVDWTNQTPGATSITENSSNAATVTINQSGSPSAEIEGSYPLMIDGTEYPVSPTIGMRTQKLDRVRRAFSGKIRTALHDDSHTTARVWDIPIGLLTDAEARALKALLVAPGTIDLAGDVIGSTVTCHVVGEPEWIEGSLDDAVMIRATFEEVLS